MSKHIGLMGSSNVLNSVAAIVPHIQAHIKYSDRVKNVVLVSCIMLNSC